MMDFTVTEAYKITESYEITVYLMVIAVSISLFETKLKDLHQMDYDF